jgi:succinate dehydrogenase / fumarate reductase iron-sulfur subunit
MKKTIRILRRKSREDKPYYEAFPFETEDEGATVATALMQISRTSDLTWEHSCLQKKCGACAMVINGEPALACEVFLRDLKGEVVTVEPLRKFPVIRDLRVDRSIIYENLREANAYIEEYEGSDPKEHDHQYAAGKCLKCGLCLEVCPNYVSGENFFGALYANDCFLISSMSTEGKGEIKRAYDRHFAAGCSKSLSCMDVCPMKIQTITSMARMNRR